jgi:phosphatidylglycerol:prolipoprotein diacylglycerol transferase
MRWLTDLTYVHFPNMGLFNVPVYETLVEFYLGTALIEIKFYGVIIAIGFTLAVLFGGRMAYKWKLSLDKMLDVLIWGTFAGILGARLYYVAFEWDHYKNNLMDIFKIWEGGLAIYGGIIGAFIAAYFVCQKVDLNFYKLLDLAGMSLLIGQGIGRWGNFTNQEAFGTNTTLPWGMTSDKIESYINSNYAFLTENGMTVDSSAPVHPTFLYESIWCILGFFVLFYICQKHRKFDGQIILGYGIIYGLERFFVEGLRTDSLYIGESNLRVSQVISMFLVLSCAALMTAKLIEIKKGNKEKVEKYKQKQKGKK